MSPRLPFETFLDAVRHVPLVAIDLLVQDAEGRYLLGLRTIKPAAGYWFVPGGRIYKDETLQQAFVRISRDELGVELSIDDATFVGVHEHFYDENAGGVEGFGTHYVALGYRLQGDASALNLPTDQHESYRWLGLAELAEDSTVHPHTRRYFD